MKKMNRFGKILPLFLVVAAGFVSCQEDDAIGSAGASLQVSVTAGSPMVSRAIVTDEYLPDGSTIGVTVTDADGNSYDSQNYSNVKYTAAGQGDAQTWTGASDVSLSTTVGKAVAYYPWQEGADLTAIPVETASQTDYMYSKPVTGLSLASPAASFTMQHALTDIRIKVIRGDYTGEGALESVSVKSSAFATGATLNVHDGSLSAVTGAGTEFKSEYTDKTITAEGLVQDYLVVPVVSVTSGDVSVFIVVDGKKFTAPVQFTEAFLQGAAYSFGLVLDNAGLNVTSVTAEKWGVVSQVVAQPELQPNPDEYIIRVSIPEGEDNNGGVEEASLFSLNRSSNNALKTAYKKFMEGRTAPVLNSRAATNTRPFVHNVVGFVGTIYWGDGTIETFEEPTDWPSHEYPNGGTEYTVTAKGTMTGLSTYFDWENEDFPYFPECLSEFIFLGEDCGVESLEYAFYGCESLQEIPEGLNKALKNVENFNLAFAYCENLQSIPEGLFDNCTEVTSFGGTFAGCGLTSIPEGLFDKCTKVENFNITVFDDEAYGCFGGCTSLTAIPEGLFDKCTEVTDFGWTFNDCYSLQTIPSGLFEYNTKVTNFDGVFAGTSIIAIPEGLFDYNTEVTSFAGTFGWCLSLQTIPNGLFDNCTKVTNFYEAFRGCSNLEAIPEGLFDYNTKVTSFQGVYGGCSKLQTVPVGLFDNCTEVTDFESAFAVCELLQSVPAGLFDKNTKVTSFEATFNGCKSLTTIPQGLFDKCTEVESFGLTFYRCTSLTNIPNGLFDNCTEVTDFGRAFAYCYSLQAISNGLFDNCTKVTSFRQTFCNSGITAISEGLFDNCTEVTDFNRTFEDCAGLTSIPQGLFDNCTEVTTFSNTFAGCTSLQNIPEGMFDKCTKVTDFSYAFGSCTGLTSIPEGLFDYCTKVTNFYGTFGKCVNLTGESPYTVIQVDGVDTKVHLYERSAYPDVFTAPTSFTVCFLNCTGLTDYGSIPTEWK